MFGVDVYVRSDINTHPEHIPAAVAVGHKILVIVYHLLWQGTYYEEQRYADQRPTQEERDCKRAITALKRLGYDVTVKRIG